MKNDKWKKLRIKIIGLIGCVLLIVVGIYFVSFIRKYPYLIFLVLLAEVIFFCKIFFSAKSVETRKKQRAAKAKTKAKIKAESSQWKHHRFYLISKRAEGCIYNLILRKCPKIL